MMCEQTASILWLVPLQRPRGPYRSGRIDRPTKVVVPMWSPVSVSHQKKSFERYAAYLRTEKAPDVVVMGASDRAPAEQLVRATVPGMANATFDDDMGGIVARTKSNEPEIVAVVGVSAYEVDSVKFRVIRLVAVRGDYQGKGLGAVCLNAARQRFLPDANYTYGNCSPSEAPFYARTGFTVLDPGVAFPFVSGRSRLQIASATQPCGFYLSH